MSKIVEDVVYQHQRWYPIVGWSSNVLPSDPAASTDEEGKPCNIDEILPPSNLWQYINDWHFADDDPENGWTYASGFNSSRWLRLKTPFTVARKRRWIRTRKRRDLTKEVAGQMVTVDFTSLIQDEVERLLKQFDKNHDGVLDRIELSEYLRTVMSLNNVSESQILTTKTVKKHYSEIGNGICVICFENKANCCIIPCGHHVTCMKCNAEYQEINQSCIMCRRQIDNFIETYSS